eukprot:GHVS01096317.1.p1 GENE.GHVS01096317.1~~GHVS01096317.1.p1  ORF type:complete len:256 (+),score=62.03 GHVS01096317.1:505-1272(+)
MEEHSKEAKQKQSHLLEKQKRESEQSQKRHLDIAGQLEGRKAEIEKLKERVEVAEANRVVQTQAAADMQKTVAAEKSKAKLREDEWVRLSEILRRSESHAKILEEESVAQVRVREKEMTDVLNQLKEASLSQTRLEQHKEEAKALCVHTEKKLFDFETIRQKERLEADNAMAKKVEAFTRQLEDAKKLLDDERAETHDMEEQNSKQQQQMQANIRELEENLHQAGKQTADEMRATIAKVTLEIHTYTQLVKGHRS